MLRLKLEQRRLAATHLPELANFAAGSFWFGQVLTGRPYSVAVALFGFVFWALIFGSALFLAKED
jgi:hypothetical protein